MRRIKLVVAYDGTGFNGWQVQPGANTIQGALQEAVSSVLKEKINLVGAGRTDTGVHALGQVAHFDTSKDMDAETMLRAFNANLPKGIVVRRVEDVDRSFHARFSAKSRIYRYFITKLNLPFFTRYAWLVPYDLDVDLMKAAASLFVGEHDFACYGKPMVPGGNTVRTVYRCDVRARRWRIEVVIEANAFLRKMVRNVVGTLVKVASGKASSEDVSLSLTQKRPVKGVKPAPPHGLFLWEVRY